MKYQPPGARHLLSLAAFELTQQNTVVSDGSVTSQVGETSGSGVEFEARIVFDSGLGTVVSVARLDSEITTGTEANEGNRVPYVPETQAALCATYDFGARRGGSALFGHTVNGGLRYYGASYGDDGNTLETDGYLLADAGMSFELGVLARSLDGVKAPVSAANLLDEKHVSSCNNTTTCYWGAGRRVRAAFDYEW